MVVVVVVVAGEKEGRGDDESMWRGKGRGLGEESVGFSMPLISRTIKKIKQIKN